MQNNAQLSKLTTALGSPFFCYDLDAMAIHAQALQVLPVTLWYAVKANPLSAVIQTLHQSGLRFDVASIGECKQVLAQGVAPNYIVHTGPAKSLAQCEWFVGAGIRWFVAESLQQIHDLNLAGAKQQVKLKILLRVQLQWSSAQDNVLGGCEPTPFGLPPETWGKLNLADFRHVDVQGMHVFQWGNILSISQLQHIWQTMLLPLQQLAKTLHMNWRVIDLGGGLGIPYSKADSALVLSEVAAALNEIQKRCPGIDLWMELGRYVTGPFGVYATPVVDRKTVYEVEMLVLAGGVNHILRPVLAGQDFPVRLLRESQADPICFQLRGPLCTGLDQVAEQALPSDIKVGDWLVLSQCGAYGFTESMPWFLCHDLPAEVVLRQQRIEVIRSVEMAGSWLK